MSTLLEARELLSDIYFGQLRGEAADEILRSQLAALPPEFAETGRQVTEAFEAQNPDDRSRPLARREVAGFLDAANTFLRARNGEVWIPYNYNVLPSMAAKHAQRVRTAIRYGVPVLAGL